MLAKLFSLLLFASQIILNGSYVIYAGSETSATTLPEGYVRFPDVHAAYKIYKTPTSWLNARDRCNSEGATLAIADTTNKIVHINSLKTTDWGGHWIHVGIYRSNVTDRWIRVDNGLPATSLQWASFVTAPIMDCAAIPLSEKKLVDTTCGQSEEYYACEITI